MSKWRGHDGVLCQKFIPPFWCSVNFMFASALSLYLGTYFRCQQTTLFQTWQLCLHHVESNHSNLFMKVAALAQQRADEPPHEARINRFIAPTGETVKPLRINISQNHVPKWSKPFIWPNFTNLDVQTMSKRYGNQHVTWFQTIGCCDWVSTTSCCEDRHTENSLDHVLFWQKIHQGLGGPVLPFQWRLSLANKSSVYPHIHQSFMFWFLQILQTFPSGKGQKEKSRSPWPSSSTWFCVSEASNTTQPPHHHMFGYNGSPHPGGWPGDSDGLQWMNQCEKVYAQTKKWYHDDIDCWKICMS